MTQQAKTLFVAIVLISASSWVVMEFGPRACGKSTQEPEGQVETFAHEACRAFVQSDEIAFGDLVVREGDTSVDERYGWFPYAGAAKTDFEPWAERAKQAAIATRAELGETVWTCGKVVDVERTARVRDMQGRVPRISIEINSGDRTEVLDLGPSVRAKRGRVFQGAEDGVFVRRSDREPGDTATM